MDKQELVAGELCTQHARPLRRRLRRTAPVTAKPSRKWHGTKPQGPELSLNPIESLNVHNVDLQS